MGMGTNTAGFDCFFDCFGFVSSALSASSHTSCSFQEQRRNLDVHGVPTLEELDEDMLRSAVFVNWMSR